MKTALLLTLLTRFALYPAVVFVAFTFLRYVFHPDRHAQRYNYVHNEDIRLELVINSYRDESSQLKTGWNHAECPYWRLIAMNSLRGREEVYLRRSFIPPKLGNLSIKFYENSQS